LPENPGVPADPIFNVATIAERPDVLDEVRALGGSAWPAFLGHDDVINRHWNQLWELVPDYQFALVEERSESVLACGNLLPIVWDGNAGTLPEGGVDSVLADGVEAIRRGTRPTAASALMIVVRQDMRGRGLSGACVEAMRAITKAHGLASLVAPVRPTHKHRYPLIPIERYARWRRRDGSLFDPWLRIHERAGAEVVRIAPASMRISGTVADWEAWTGIDFPGTGSYVVGGALVPVEIDRERDEGLYVEPNVWMHHRIADISGFCG
jgi:GNAT superfamily N-acetyltransferase